MEQKAELSALTKDELIEKINELNTRIEELTTPPHNDWHSWFYALLMILGNNARNSGSKSGFHCGKRGQVRGFGLEDFLAIR